MRTMYLYLSLYSEIYKIKFFLKLIINPNNAIESQNCLITYNSDNNFSIHSIEKQLIVDKK
jgi:hypothetical protein